MESNECIGNIASALQRLRWLSRKPWMNDIEWLGACGNSLNCVTRQSALSGWRATMRKILNFLIFNFSSSCIAIIYRRWAQIICNDDWYPKISLWLIFIRPWENKAGMGKKTRCSRCIRNFINDIETFFVCIWPLFAFFSDIASRSDFIFTYKMKVLLE